MENNQDRNEKGVHPLIDQTEAAKNNDRYFNLLVNEVPYRIEFEPFFFNDQVRYYVNINAGPKDVFVWDTSMEQFRAINDNAAVLPVALEKAISLKLEHQNLE